MASAASASSPGYTTVSTNCDGTPIHVIKPDAGHGFPASLLANVPAATAARLESTALNWVVPTCVQEPGLADWADESATSSEPYLGSNQSYNWSGYLVYPASGSGNTYNDVEAQWDVPSVTSSTGDDQYASSWVGLGTGKGTDSAGQSYLLDQAGTLQSVVNGTKLYRFFWELYPENAEQTVTLNGLSLPAISPGNAVEALVEHLNTYTTEYFLENLTTKNVVAFTVTWGASYVEGGGQAEWIMERPTIDNAFPQLADFGTFTFHNMYVVNENGDKYDPGQLTRAHDYMTNCLVTQTLARPNNLVNGTAADNYGTIDWVTSGGDGTC